MIKLLLQEIVCMTEEEQKLYDVIADWWGDAETQDKDPIIDDLVHSIMDLKYNNVPEDE